MDAMQTTATELFVTHRDLLFTVAYEMLGSAADAEDVLQEAWIRWVKVELDRIDNPRAYLVQIVARRSLNHLRAVSRRKETYVGEWLPEPLLTAPDVADNVELAESVSTALMLVLETLVPTERAVFVLRDVFDVGYSDIARVLDKSEDAVRQIAHRARRRVQAGRPRTVVAPHEARAVIEKFRRALESGDIEALLRVLTPDVVLIADGGGVRKAALRPVVGARKVIAMMLGAVERFNLSPTAVVASVNGSPALLISLDGVLDGVISARVEESRIADLYYVRNPEKLQRLDVEHALRAQ